MIQDLVTVPEAAKIKGVTRSVIYKAIERGDLKTKIVLGRKALRRQDVLAWEPLKAGRRSGVPITEATKLKISEAQKARWQHRKRSTPENNAPEADSSEAR